MSVKTLVAYASKSGGAEKAALEITKVLREGQKLSVDVINLRKKKDYDISEYSNIVAGAGVRMGKIYGEFWKLLDKDVSKKNLAFFIVCGKAGKPENHDSIQETHLKTILSKHPNLEPVDFEVFGGRFRLFGKIIDDSCKPEMVRAWAEKLGKKLK